MTWGETGGAYIVGPTLAVGLGVGWSAGRTTTGLEEQKMGNLAHTWTRGNGYACNKTNTGVPSGTIMHFCVEVNSMYPAL
jgi:hypothetical protein